MSLHMVKYFLRRVPSLVKRWLCVCARTRACVLLGETKKHFWMLIKVHCCTLLHKDVRQLVTDQIGPFVDMTFVSCTCDEQVFQAYHTPSNVKSVGCNNRRGSGQEQLQLPPSPCNELGVLKASVRWPG